MTNKQIAERLRKLAKGAEKLEAQIAACGTGLPERIWQHLKDGGRIIQNGFTCNAVEQAFFDRGGYERGAFLRRQYAEVFGMGMNGGNKTALWHDPACPSIRVLMLCFAASMAEAGDLL